MNTLKEHMIPRNRPVNGYLLTLSCLLFFFMFVCTPIKLSAQISPQFYDYSHNHLPWYTIESDHFLIHYQEGSSRTGQVASRIAEEIYRPITDLYRYAPNRKISIVIRDREDFSNGAAFFFDDKIEIWVPALDTPLRGTHNWLRNVITHEFTHLIQLQASMNWTKRIPAMYLQWLSYEDVRRPDVLYGFPNSIVSHPFATVSIPAWFAEGSAQYQRTGLTYDYWDSHREMVLRTRILDSNYLDLTQMGTFTSKSSLERELVYNQGFSFTIYLVARFGEDILRKLSVESARGSANFARVLEVVTGIDGNRIFKDWLDERTDYFRKAVEDLQYTDSNIVHDTGFFNFYPVISPDGNTLAFLSSQEKEYVRVSLILKDLDQPDTRLVTIDHTGGLESLTGQKAYKVKHSMTSNAALDFISAKFSFSPDGETIVYSRKDKNLYGENYDDLYSYHLSSGSRKKLTENMRIREPAWSPDANYIAAVRLENGTQNLVLYRLEDEELNNLTRYTSGETVYTPVWHPGGKKIYYTTADLGHREIRLFNLENGDSELLLTDEVTDFRDPFIDAEGRFLYYSADPDGIFNIYRIQLERNHREKVTSVPGGAFQPFVHNDKLYYSEYRSDGYKISSLDLSDQPEVLSGHYSPPERETYLSADFNLSGITGADINRLNQFDDRDLQPLDHADLLSSGAGEASINIPTTNASDERILKTYSETTTGFSFFPLLRFDNYTQLRGRNSRLLRQGKASDLGENLWRDMKLGFIFSSRDVTERLSLMGGAMVGFGSLPADQATDFFRPSRLNNLDRDLFLTLEHRGLPFIKRSWSPTIVLEFFNIKRNVRNGLQIEEFPCTSCLPETTRADITYNIWEAGIYLRSKLNRWSLLELGAAYSPYRVATDNFFSSELRQLVPSSSSEYFKSTTLSASYHVELIEPTRHADIAPRGLRGHIAYRYQPSRLLDSYEIMDGVLSPVYETDRNHSIELDTRYGIGTGNRSSLRIHSRAFTYLNNPDDFFYLDYIGGLSGMRSYPYFAIGGEKTIFSILSWNLPLFENINRQVGQYTFDKIFARLFFEAGNGWDSPLKIGNKLKTGVGAELRFAFNNYYLFPMKLFLSGSYGLNRFETTFSDDFIINSDMNTVRYGRSLQLHFGLTFDFDPF